MENPGERPDPSQPLEEVEKLNSFIERLYQRQKEVAKRMGSLRERRQFLLEDEDVDADEIKSFDEALVSAENELAVLEIETDKYQKMRDEQGEKYHRQRKELEDLENK